MHRRITLFTFLIAGLCGIQSAHADSCNGVSASQNLITNCGFETGSFSGWSGDATTTPGYGGVDNGDPYSTQPTPFEGVYEAFLGNPTVPFTLSQTFNTEVGVGYIIQFALLNDTDPPNGFTNSFTALFGGDTLFSVTDALAGAYTFYTFTATATSTSTTLSFISQNDAGAFELDSVSVAETPEPSGFVLLGTGLLGGAAGLARRPIVGYPSGNIERPLSLPVMSD